MNRVRSTYLAARMYRSNEDLSYRDLVYTLPRVDFRSLINSPGYDIADPFRDAVLLYLFDLSPDVATLDVFRRIFNVYLKVKSDLSVLLIERLLEEVKL